MHTVNLLTVNCTLLCTENWTMWTEQYDLLVVTSFVTCLNLQVSLDQSQHCLATLLTQQLNFQLSASKLQGEMLKEECISTKKSQKGPIREEKRPFRDFLKGLYQHY